MSDDSIKMSFVADDKEMLASYRRMQKELENYKKKLAEVGQEHKKGEDAVKQSAKEQERAIKQASKAQIAAAREAARAQKDAADSGANALINYAAGYLTLQTGVQVVKSLYTAWAQEIKRVEDAHKGLHTEMVKTLAAGNDLRNATAIEAALKNIPGLAPSDATRAFAAATGAAPGMDWQTRADIVKGAAPLAGMGQDVGAHTGLATKLKQLDPSLSTADANDMALMMRKRAGEDAGKLGSDEFISSVGKLKTAGLSAEQSFAIGLADVEADLPSKGLKTLAESLYEGDPNAGKRLKTKADRDKAAFYKLSAADRFAALQGSKATAESVLGAGGALALASRGGLGEQLAAVQSVRTGDLMGQEAQTFKQWDDGRLAAAEYATKEKIERLDDEQGTPYGQATAVRNRFLAMKRENETPMLLRGIADLHMRGRAVANEARGISPLESTERYIQAASGTLTKEQNEELKALIAALKENTTATKANTPKIPGKDINRHVDANN
jgi:hypothetical protein